RRKVEAALADRRRRVVDAEDLIPAAVLLLLTNRGGPHVLFAKRTERVAHHKGQYSFPGGLVETWDGSRLETALREAHEEIGLLPEAVEVLGTLDDAETRATQFVITPFVGLIREPVRYTPDGKEIEKVLEVPLSALLDPANFRVEMWEHSGEVHPVYFYDYHGETIWGATARILKQFLDIVFPEGAER
ncbi:MAG: CoA pyrophosphatase, partial [Candidatus Rokubacteria bacterium]|nr:CoA pyrophosphatase [Candidatus Rokubacteria bacterium]